MKSLILLAPLALAACATVPAESAGATAGFGRTATVGPLRVAPLALVEDSRCPQGVQCVWAGRVRITARIAGETRELTQGEPVAAGGGRLTLAEVEPAKRVDRAIAPADYRFTFRFDGGA